MESDKEHIKPLIEKSPACIPINRAEKLNALSWDMMLRVKEHAEQIDLNRQIRAVIIYAETPKTFGVGADFSGY